MKQTNKTLVIALAALFTSSMTLAETEVTGKLSYETSAFSKSGSIIGNHTNSALSAGAANVGGGVTTLTTPSHSNGNLFKSETKAQIFFDGDIKGSTFHVEVQGVFNGKAVDSYDSVEAYTQRDPLREAYIDTESGDWSIRAGKQQVVWGTADGIKLLDTINPTDYSEISQNSPEDSRITTWMLNVEKDLEDGSNIQIIVSQPKENIFAGLNRGIDTSVRNNNTTGAVHAGAFTDETLNNGTDTGHAFIMKGPDTITGVRNGFLNIVPDLGTVARGFAQGFGAAGNLFGADGATQGNNVTTVGAFASNNMQTLNRGAVATSAAGAVVFANLPANFTNSIVGVAAQVNGVIPANVTAGQASAVTGAQMLQFGFQPYYNTNLVNYAPDAAGAITDTAQNSAFEYMQNTTFATFDSFVNAKSQYVYNMPSDANVDVAARFKGSTQGGVNYSVNASYNYDKNPIINMSWRGDAGQKLAVRETYHAANGVGTTQALGVTTTLQLYDPANANALAQITAAGNGVASLGAAANTDYGLYGGASQASAIAGNADNIATLQFSQEVVRVKQIGGSFDTAIETKGLGPVVIRGEALYTKDGRSPVMNKTRLAVGDLVGALQMKTADRFKYVLGVDITVLKNMLVSAQFIQDRNLDYVDDGSAYTADYATMHLSNGFKKAEKNKEFYSLFLSKPFGASGEHRWNNIFILEDNGGKWNRLDAEFTINDDTIFTLEYNKYFGGENTQFGQLKNSSNIQAGLKYTF